MLAQVSGMYRFNEPIWKLAEMKKECFARRTECHYLSTRRGRPRHSGPSGAGGGVVAAARHFPDLKLGPLCNFRAGRVGRDHPRCC